MGDVEQQVRAYYDVAGPAYEALMGMFWHHGELESERAGLSTVESAMALERKVVAWAGLEPGDFAMDFGSGIGGTTTYMAEVSGAHFVGVCNNDWLSRRAREYARERNMSAQVSFHAIGDEDYRTFSAWPDGCLDAVTWYESVCHLPDKAAFFRAVARILKPGGRLVGVDWLQRPFGEHQTEDQIKRWMAPMERATSIPWHGTVDSYRAMIEDAGLVVEVAEDMYAGVHCWGGTPPEDGQGWLKYDGADFERFADGKRTLDAARAAGVFTAGKFVAVKPV